MHNRTAHGLATLLVLTVASGTSCPRAFQRVQPAPVVFPTEPTLADLMQVVNHNHSLIRSLYSTRATLNGTGFPMLKANLAVVSPRHVRLRAGLGLAGSELDLGSNQELFWIWIKRSEPPALYYGYHDRYAASPLQQVFPVQPEWLVEAIGLTGLDPAGRHQGPYRRGDGRLEVRTLVATAQGEMSKSTVVDQTSGWIVEQHLFGPQGQLIASAYNRNHQRDPVSGGVLAHSTELHWPQANLKLTLELKEVQINPPQLGAELWARPDYPGYVNVEVTQPAGAPPSVPASPFQPYAPIPSNAGNLTAPLASPLPPPTSIMPNAVLPNAALPGSVLPGLVPSAAQPNYWPAPDRSGVLGQRLP